MAPFDVGAMACAASFASIGTRIMQQKLVENEILPAIFVVSCIIAAMDLITVVAVVKGGWDLYPWVAFGSSSGAVVAVIAHRKFKK